MASIRERPRKGGVVTYAVLYTLDGRQSSLPFDSKKHAEAFKAAIEAHGAARALAMHGINSAPRRRGRNDRTLADWLTHHIDHLTGVERATLARYRSYVAKDIGPTIGQIPIAALSRDDVARWVNAMTEAGASGKTVANKHGFLAGALNAAVTAGQIAANPCDGKRLPRWDREEMAFLTRAEFGILIEAVPLYWRPLVEFLVASGCRWSEATALKPADVDRKAGTVRISRAWKSGAGGHRLGVPKTRRSRRTINMPTSMLDKLDYSGEWLFTNSGRGNRNQGGPVRLPSFSQNVWKPAIARAQAAGLEKRPRVHDLRHTCASWLIQSGVPMPVVQQHLGHESIQTTIATYTHLDRTSAQAAALAMGALLTD